MYYCRRRWVAQYTLSGHGLNDDVTIYYLSLLLLLRQYNIVMCSVEKTTRFHWPRSDRKSAAKVALNRPNWPRCEINRFRWKRTPPPPYLHKNTICPTLYRVCMIIIRPPNNVIWRIYYTFRLGILFRPISYSTRVTRLGENLERYSSRPSSSSSLYY